MTVSAKTAATAAVATVAVVIGAGVWLVYGGAEPDRFAQCRSGTGLGTGLGAANIGGPFTLVSETGATVTERDVITRPSLVYFGYTFCPDVCPIDSTRNAAAVELLEKAGQDVGTIFISVDSARDTPASLTEFTDLMSPKMIGLSGSPEQVEAAVKAYRAYYRVQNPGDPNTLIDHSTQTYLMDPKLGFLDYYDRDVPPETVAQSVGCFVDALKTNENRPVSGNGN
jgi:protein SCO1/2